MIFAKKLELLRKQKGFSQEDLAVQLGLSRQAVYKWETSQSTPDIDNLRILSKMFNVSVDNLLDDEADIIYKNAPQKTKAGKVVILDTPSSDSAETDNTTFLPDEQKKVKIRKAVVGASFGIMVGTLALFLVLLVVQAIALMDTPNSETHILFQLYMVSGLLFVYLGIPALLVYLLTNRFLFSNLYEKRTYFKTKKAEIEQELQAKNYEFIQLQHDLLQWFYYNPENATFGFYFDGKEQMICPIQNYVNLSCEDRPDEEIAVGTKTGVGLVVGSLSGVTLNRESEMAKLKQTHFPVRLAYTDETETLQAYTFSLKTIRKYPFHIYKDAGGGVMYCNSVSASTKQAYLKIKEKLEYEKSRVR